METRWKLELWLDGHGEVTQVNGVLVDHHNRQLAVRVVPMPEGNLLGSEIVPLLAEVLGITEQPRLPAF